MEVLVYTQRYTHRTGYIFRFIFEEILGVNVRFTSSYTEVKAHMGVLISYFKTRVKDGIHVVPHNLLIEDSITPQQINLFEWNKLTAFFKTSDEADIPFDLFAASFYLVSRYEEYLNFNPDKHGRYPSSISLAAKAGFLDQPLIDQWAYQLVAVIQKKYPAFEIHKRKFSTITTIDVDNAYAFSHKGILRSVLGSFLSLAKLNFFELYYRIKVYFKISKDPYDVYDQLFDLLKQNEKVIWFIPVADPGPYDRNLSVRNKGVRKLIKEIGRKYRVGIHPSYRSGINVERLRLEISSLVNILDKEISCSRQHFIRILLPYTYRNLVVSGITEDYSMGYTDKVGFRASTCTPFKFFDLLQNRVINLLVYPFQTMDFTYLEVLKYTPEKTVQDVVTLAKRVKEVDGTFISIWHNEYFSDYTNWKGWNIVLPSVIEELNKLEGENKVHSQ